MRVLGIFFLLLPLGGCGYHTAKVRPFIGPDGRQAFHITCNDDRGRCLEAAGETCPEGYKVVKK